MAAHTSGLEQARSFSSPQEEALLTLMRSADQMQRAMHQRLKPAGLTPTQFNVLRILRGARPAGLTCSAIGSRMITTEPDITRLLGRLKKQKLLCQQRDTQDRRVVWNHISESGLESLASIDQLVEEAPRDLLKELTGTEVQELTRLLKKIQCSAGAENPPCPSSTAKLPLPKSPHRHPLE